MIAYTHIAKPGCKQQYFILVDDKMSRVTTKKPDCEIFQTTLAIIPFTKITLQDDLATPKQIADKLAEFVLHPDDMILE